MNKHTFYYIVLSIVLFVSCTSNSEKSTDSTDAKEISGKVIKIVDGDTYDLLTADKQTLRIRMEGIDAPERGMPYYKVAKNYLGSLCFQKNVTVIVKETDVHGRLVANTYLDEKEIGQEMIRTGLAWHFKKYSSDTLLSRLETEARLNKKGLWINSEPMSPWNNRKYHREGISTKDSFGNNKFNQ